MSGNETMSSTNDSLRSWIREHMAEIIALGVLATWCVVVTIW